MSINDSLVSLRGHDNSNYGSKKYGLQVRAEDVKLAYAADVICCGRLLQIRAAATGKARSP